MADIFDYYPDDDLFKTYLTRSFAEIFPTASEFLSEYKTSAIPKVITEDNVIKALKDINLVLCGHTHGGLTPNFLQRYLKNRIFISPDKKKFFVNNGYGYLPLNNLDIIMVVYDESGNMLDTYIY